MHTASTGESASSHPSNRAAPPVPLGGEIGTPMTEMKTIEWRRVRCDDVAVDPEPVDSPVTSPAFATDNEKFTSSIWPARLQKCPSPCGELARVSCPIPPADTHAGSTCLLSCRTPRTDQSDRSRRIMPSSARKQLRSASTGRQRLLRMVGGGSDTSGGKITVRRRRPLSTMRALR